MNKNSKHFILSTLVACILISVFSVQAIFAASLDFGTAGGPTSGGAYFLYSDMPESLYDSVIPGSGIYVGLSNMCYTISKKIMERFIRRFPA